MTTRPRLVLLAGALSVAAVTAGVPHLPAAGAVAVAETRPGHGQTIAIFQPGTGPGRHNCNATLTSTVTGTIATGGALNLDMTVVGDEPDLAIPDAAHATITIGVLDADGTWDYVLPAPENIETNTGVLDPVPIDEDRTAFWSITDSPRSENVDDRLVYTVDLPGDPVAVQILITGEFRTTDGRCAWTSGVVHDLGAMPYDGVLEPLDSSDLAPGFGAETLSHCGVRWRADIMEHPTAPGESATVRWRLQNPTVLPAGDLMLPVRMYEPTVAFAPRDSVTSPDRGSVIDGVWHTGPVEIGEIVEFVAVYETDPAADPGGAALLSSQAPFSLGLIEAHAAPCESGSPSIFGFDGLGVAYQELVDLEVVAEDDWAETDQGQSVWIDVLANDTWTDDYDPQVAKVLGARYGFAELMPWGPVAYQPLPGFVGTDVVVYELCITDGTQQACDTATIEIDVHPRFDTVARPDRAVATVDGPTVTVDVLGNDDGGWSVLPASGATSEGGSYQCTSLVCEYTPPAGFEGVDTFGYWLLGDDIDDATVTVFVRPDPLTPAGFYDTEQAPLVAETGAVDSVVTATVDDVDCDDQPYVTLTWDSAPEGEYQLERRTDGGPWVEVGTVTWTWVTDHLVDVGREHEYRVTALAGRWTGPAGPSTAPVATPSCL